MSYSVDAFKSAMCTIWGDFGSTTGRMFMGLKEASNIGVDISDAPAGSICVITPDSVSFEIPE